MKAIVAMDPNRVIGCNGNLPWHLPDDLKWFKEVTANNPLLMGRNTFESIGKSLPNRFIYIITNNPTKISLPKDKSCQYIHKDVIFHALNQGSNEYMPINDLWVCGGATIYQEFLPFCKEVYVSHLTDTYDGDTYMPEFEHMFPKQEVIRYYPDFWVCKHSKLPSAPILQKDGHFKFAW